MSDPDAVVVGAGPNGLMAAVVLARAGWKVLVVEQAGVAGGGTRTEALIRPDVVHDVCSAIHPLALASPAFRALADEGALVDHGLEWVHPPIPLAHPLDGGGAAVLRRSVDETAEGLGADREAYRSLLQPHVTAGFDLTDGLLSPLRVPPRHPVHLARFAKDGMWPATTLAVRRLQTPEAQALFAGLAAHAVLALTTPITAAYGLTLGVLGHLVGWPLARGGSQRIADALVGIIEHAGGAVECDRYVTSLEDLPPARATLLDLTPRQVLNVLGDRAPSGYRRTLGRYRYGPGVVKVDWILDGPVPWTNPLCAEAATVHLGGTLQEITGAEAAVMRGRHPHRPYVLLAQPSSFDPTRAPDGLHAVWAYCHVPNRSTVDVSERIDAQVERFAPGFRDRIVGRHVMTTADMQDHNPNYVGGDINGGAGDLRQFLARPTLGLHPWRTPVDGVWICSASTPPGGGVHGMGGYHAARDVLARLG